MKIRLLLGLAGLAIGFALPSFAQQKDAVDPELMKAALYSCQVFDNAFNNNDPEAFANLFTGDATFVTDTGVLHGRDDILQYQIGVFKVVHFSNHKNVPISSYPIGTDGKQFWATGSWSHTVQVKGGEPTEQKGFWSAIIVNDGTGKHVMQTWNITPAPAPTTTPSQTSSKEEKNPVDPQVRQQIDAVYMQFQEAYNKHDAAALAAEYSADAVEVRSWATSWNGGTHFGQQAIEKMFETDFKLNPGKMVNKLVQLYPIANEVCAIANRSVGTWKGHTVTIYVRALDPDTWKVHMTYVNELPP